MTFQSLCKAFVALLCRRTAHQRRHLKHQRPVFRSYDTVDNIDHIHTDGVAGLHIAGTDEGSVVVAFHRAVEAYHRDTLLPDSLNGCSDRPRLIGSYHQQVDARVHQTVYLAHLQLRIVVSTRYCHLHIFLIQMLRCQHLVVHFLTPSPFSTLRHTNLISLLLSA